jgi:hypothetical protein
VIAEEIEQELPAVEPETPASRLDSGALVDAAVRKEAEQMRLAVLIAVSPAPRAQRGGFLHRPELPLLGAHRSGHPESDKEIVHLPAPTVRVPGHS